MTIGRTRLGYQSKGYRHTIDAAADQSLLTCEIPFKHSATVAVYITAIADTGDYLFERSVHSVSRDGATATYIGEVSNDSLSLGAGAWATTIDCTGTTLRVRVTGEAAHVIEWTAVAVFETSAVNVPIVWECATTDTTQSWTVRVTNLVNYWFDWGDGNFDAVVGSGADQVTAHNYAAAGRYAIRVMIEDATDLLRLQSNSNGLHGSWPDLGASTALSYLHVNGNLLTGTAPSVAANTLFWELRCSANAELGGPFPDLTTNVSLRYLFADSCAFTGSIPSMAALVTLVWCYFNNNQFSGSIPSLATCEALQYFQCHANALTNDIPDLTGAAALKLFRCSANQITGYTAGIIGANCVTFNVADNLLPESAIDQILADFETGIAGRPAAGTIALGGTGNAPPSAAGLASKAAILAAKPGWGITHN